MKKSLIVVVMLLVVMFSSVTVMAAGNDLEVHLSGIRGAKIIAEYQKDGLNYYLVEKGDTTWVVSQNLDVVTGVGAVGGEWDPENLVLVFYEPTGTMYLYPANFNQVFFNLTDNGYHWGF